jgi:hypothetical protein
MKKRLQIKTCRFLSDETGMALIIVLILLLLGSLTIIPVLSHLHTALETGELYEEKTERLYTADAGIEDGLWRIKYDFMGPDYDPYDFDKAWDYATDTLNGMVANYTIKNVWVPTEPKLDAAVARDIIESEKLVVVGTSGAVIGQPYHIEIDYTPAVGDNLTIKTLGVWLPQGFEYADNCSLKFAGSTPYCPDSENITDCNGGQTIVWSYDTPYPFFTDFPGVDPAAPTMSFDFTFSYTPPAEHPNYMPTAIAWLTTAMHPSSPNPNDVPISWDVDNRIYEITSVVGDTEVQAYSSKSELRQMGDAMSGDYVAIGNSLLSNDDPSMINIVKPGILPAQLKSTPYRRMPTLFMLTSTGQGGLTKPVKRQSGRTIAQASLPTGTRTPLAAGMILSLTSAAIMMLARTGNCLWIVL